MTRFEHISEIVAATLAKFAKLASAQSQALTFANEAHWVERDPHGVTQPRDQRVLLLQLSENVVEEPESVKTLKVYGTCEIM